MDKLIKALQDIADHAKPSFMEGKWANYIREVAEEALSNKHSENIKCTNCGGNGLYFDNPCSLCDGTGYRTQNSETDYKKQYDKMCKTPVTIKAYSTKTS